MKLNDILKEFSMNRKGMFQDEQIVNQTLINKDTDKKRKLTAQKKRRKQGRTMPAFAH